MLYGHGDDDYEDIQLQWWWYSSTTTSFYSLSTNNGRDGWQSFNMLIEAIKVKESAHQINQISIKTGWELEIVVLGKFWELLFYLISCCEFHI